MTPSTFAEKKVLNELQTGLDIEFGEGRDEDRLPPAEAGSDRQIRASFVRWLAIGGDGAPTLHAKGLRIVGALITNDGPADAATPGLDLQGAVLKHNLALIACRFQAPIVLLGARLQSLILDHAHIPGSAPHKPAANEAIAGDGLETRGDVFLRGARCEAAVRLLGARIEGDLDCSQATLTNPNGNTLHADRLETRGSVFLRGARCEGEVRLLGARIGGYLSCTQATLTNPNGYTLSADRLETRGGVFLRGARCKGEVRLLGARIGGDLDCDGATLTRPGGAALVASSAEVGGILFWVGDMTVEGAVGLRAASFRAIYDDRACWPKPGQFRLDRCAYGAFVGGGVPVSANARIDWLGRQYAKGDGQEFRPQPWEQCAKVLREMGHREDARLILIDKEQRLRADRRRRMGVSLRRPLLWMRDRLLRATIAYGQRPLRALIWLGLLWFAATCWSLSAWRADAFKPNNAFVLRAPEWTRCAAPADAQIELPPGRLVYGFASDADGNRLSQLDCFLRRPEAASYPAFSAGVYAFDVLFPLVEVEQQVNWIPDSACDGHWETGLSLPNPFDDAAPFWDGGVPRVHDCIGWYAKGLVYLNIILGWALSLLAVAGFSGLVKSD